VRVRHDEGPATHVNPEPCAGIREGVGEASAGERAGQPLSRESVFPGGPRWVRFLGQSGTMCEGWLLYRPCQTEQQTGKRINNLNAFSLCVVARHGVGDWSG
jgi:hypothetical protein